MKARFLKGLRIDRTQSTYPDPLEERTTPLLKVP